MRIPDDKIEEVRAAADIADVISGFVRLKKSGKGFMGLCPFHQEKTPSFHVHPEKSLFKCFGCGKGGNVFTFIMEMERISFIEAVHLLAERYNITLPTAQKEDKETAERRDQLFAANRFAARFFYDSLQGTGGEFCRTYLKKRDWNISTQRRFGLGYAQDSWDALLTKATSSGIHEDILEDAGLIIRKDDGKKYDRFRNRLVFPIFSTGGKVVGFGARALKPEDNPKYLNSPETVIYNKSRLLYGLSFAVPHIRERDSVVLVEGYADVIALSQAGFGNAVATSGTALTKHQIRLLMRYTNNILFLYDADSAGANAMLRSIDIFLDEGIIPGIVLLPQGEDPDSYMKKYSTEDLAKLLAKPKSFVDFITGQYKEDGKLETPEGKTEAVRHIVQLLAKIQDRLKQEFYLRHISERYGIYESLLYSELDKLNAQRSKPARKTGTEKPLDEFDEDENVSVETLPPSKYEHEFMSALFKSPKDIISETLNAIHVTDFAHEGIQHILMSLLEQKEDHGAIDVQELGKAFSDNVVLQALFADFMMDNAGVSERWKEIQTVTETDMRQVLLDAYRRIVLKRVEKEILYVEQRLNHSKGDTDAEYELIRETQRLQALKVRISEARQLSELSAATE